jgi:polyphosphate kinase 2 (PPK2 family)
VHPELLAKEKIPPAGDQEYLARAVRGYRRVRALSRAQRHVILKFFLNVSKKEQRERFLDRLDQPAKNWKFSMADITERARWNRYQAVYQDIVGTPRRRRRPGTWCRPITNGSRGW